MKSKRHTKNNHAFCSSSPLLWRDLLVVFVFYAFPCSLWINQTSSPSLDVFQFPTVDRSELSLCWSVIISSYHPQLFKKFFPQPMGAIIWACFVYEWLWLRCHLYYGRCFHWLVLVRTSMLLLYNRSHFIFVLFCCVSKTLVCSKSFPRLATPWQWWQPCDKVTIVAAPWFNNPPNDSIPNNVVAATVDLWKWGYRGVCHISIPCGLFSTSYGPHNRQGIPP